MHIVYVLKSLSDNDLYIGCTSNFDKRLDYHNAGKVDSTKNRRPFILVYKEEYDSIYEAFRAEKFYKTATGKRKLKDKLALSSKG